jgi:hypothetical protein
LAADIAAAALLSVVEAAVGFDCELPASAEPASAVLESVEEVDDGDEAVAVDAPEDVVAAAVPEDGSAAGAAAGSDDTGLDVAGEPEGADGDAVDADVPVLPDGVAVGAAGVVVPGAGESPEAAGVAGPVPPVGDGGEGLVEIEVEPAAAETAVDVEVAPPEVVGVDEAGDAGVPVEVEVTLPGGSGAASVPFGEVLVGALWRAGMEASSVSRAVSGAAAR